MFMCVRGRNNRDAEVHHYFNEYAHTAPRRKDDSPFKDIEVEVRRMNITVNLKYGKNILDKGHILKHIQTSSSVNIAITLCAVAGDIY